MSSRCTRSQPITDRQPHQPAHKQRSGHRQPFPAEFRADVVRVARSRDAGVTLEQIATDFGVHPMTLSKWMRQADVDDGHRPGITGAESAENRELKRRVRLLEQENEVLRRAAAYLSQANLKLGASPK